MRVGKTIIFQSSPKLILLKLPDIIVPFSRRRYGINTCICAEKIAGPSMKSRQLLTVKVEVIPKTCQRRIQSLIDNSFILQMLH